MTSVRLRATNAIAAVPAEVPPAPAAMLPPAPACTVQMVGI